LLNRDRGWCSAHDKYVVRIVSMFRVSSASAAGEKRRIALLLALPCALLGYSTAAPAQTGAGTRIVNVAGLRFEDGGRAERVSSNPVTLTVGEVLDVAIATPSERVVARGEDDLAIPFTVSNLGNAAETFAVTVRTDRAGATVTGIAADTDNDGAYDPAVDQALDGSAMMLAAGQGRRLFVLVHGGGTEPTVVTATATAATGHGEPGTAYPGSGPDGSDAVVGRTGGIATAAVRVVAGAEAPSLAKSQSVLAPDGSARIVPGSVITYRLDARFPGPAAAVEIVDPLPDGTRFVPGSIRIDGIAASDADDEDAAAFDGAAVRVVLGDIAAALDRSIQFEVKIQ
jgi:uncharacterized repeat protein (TIGR01451 family)